MPLTIELNYFDMYPTKYNADKTKRAAKIYLDRGLISYDIYLRTIGYIDNNTIGEEDE